jgi:hypothetical protein
MKTEFKKFFIDRRFLVPLAVLFFIELILQTGIYKPFLKKNSYASNINRIIGHIVKNKQNHDPDILIVGTSVAYQGLDLKSLQEKISPTGLKIQSVAIPGSELIIQDLAVEKVLEEFKNIKLVIYVGEITMPWVSQTVLTLPTLAMLGEFDRIKSIENIIEFEYNAESDYNPNFKFLISKEKYDTIKNHFLIHGVSYADWSYILFKSIAYRRDIGDFFTGPSKRIRDYKKSILDPNQNFYDYENKYKQKMSLYPISNLESCVKLTHPAENTDLIPLGSDFDHKKAIYDTCALSLYTTKSQVRSIETNLYFKRLTSIYKKIQNKNIKIINIFAPYSHVIDEKLGGEGRLQVWKEELKKINGENAEVVDFRNIFTKENSNDYCYDVIHLNREGALVFSNALGEYILKNKTRLLE